MPKKIIDAEEIVLASEKEEAAEVLADAAENKSEEDITLAEEKSLKGNIIGEDIDLRREFRKVFKKDDGSSYAVFYTEPVHLLNSEGNAYEEIDNAFFEEEDGRHYRSGKNNFVARFSKEDNNDELFSVEKGTHRITVSAKKTKKQQGGGVVPKLRAPGKGIAKNKETLLFENTDDGTDLEYSLSSGGVKENIVVKEKRQVYRYPFILHCENVTAEFDEELKTVSFKSLETGEEVFYIPAPFMSDAVGNTSTGVFYEVKPMANGDIKFTVTADSTWINDENRFFPVVIDPQIQLSSTSAMNTYSWDNGNLYSASLHTVGTTGCGDGTCNAKRMYMSFNMPTLPRNPRIKKAELKFFQASGASECGEYPKLGLYRVTEDICTGNCTPYHNSDLIDFAKMKIGHCEDGEVVSYTFDVTTLVDQVNKGEVDVTNLVLKMIDETSECDNSIMLYGSAYSGDYAPQFIVTYESTYGVNTSYRTHTHELGRFGQGSIDLQCGNLMFESEDFAWAGNRMPVTIKHLYNSALYAYQYTANSGIKLSTANFSAIKLGLGYKLNIMQSMMATTFQHEGERHTGYVYIGENGEETFFKKSDEQVCCDSNSQCYNLYEDVISGDMLYDPVELTLKQGEETYQFDFMGRLVQIKDAAGNHMDITYTSNRITSITDGAGRDFSFAYNSNGFLTSITAPDETSILYTYSGNLLSTITYQDGKKVTFTYSSSRPTAVTLLDANGNNVYKVAYSYSGNRLYSVTEYGVEKGAFVQGARSTYSYSVASGRTIVQTTEQMDAEEGKCYDNVIKTVYTFDDEGNIVSEYVYSEDTGNTGVEGEESGIHPHSGDGGAGIVSNINNLLIGHDFENLSYWSGMPCNCSGFTVSNYSNDSYSKFGGKTCWIRNYGQDDDLNGIYQVSNTLPAGEYTFSVYAKIDGAFSGSNNPGVFIRVTDTSDNVLAESEHLTAVSSEYVRLIAPFEIASAQSVKVEIMISGRGSVDVDGAQLENNPYANAYNMLENGNFERGVSGWSSDTGGMTYSTTTRFNMSKSLLLNGNIESEREAYQNVTVKKTRSTRETFTLSGWAKGYGLPNHEREGVTTPTFRLRAVVYYYDTYYREYGSETFTADFSPCTEEWQFASVQFAKSKYRTINYVRVYCDYGYNTGTAYFDDIQLVRNSLETGLSASDFVVESTGESEENTETTDTTPTFNEAKDKFGNALTETTFTDGEFGTIYRAFSFNVDLDNSGNAGNDLICETDARGNTTEYTVDEDTSRNEEVTDRCGNKTSYEYDESGRTTKVTSHKPKLDIDGEKITDENGNILYEEIANVSYSYDSFDNLTQITRGDGLDYVLKYNAFHNLESIGVDGKTDGDLIKYTYKTGNGRLKEIAYANGDKMKATYNGVGQMVAEKWYNSLNELTAHYKYVYDGQGNIVRSIDILGQKEYNYEYDAGKVVRATESDIVLSDEMVVSKSLVNTVKYYYDADDKMTKKVITSASGSVQTIYYENSEDNTVVKFNAGGKTITAHSKTDSFGRKVFDELQLGTDFVSRQFVYHAGKVTDEHKEKAKVKSSATTQLVSQIILSNGTTLSYGYDAEERITSVVEAYEIDGVPVTNTTLYIYDALGQLLTETINGTVVNTMTYDNYGNIQTKNGVEYTYGDESWKDLLTGVGDQAISYDAQGNPISYLGHTLTWEKGRQLKSFDDIQYTYNANGIRTCKIVDGICHHYAFDGNDIVRESWNGNVLITLFDNEENVCGIIYNNEPYYFHKNLQGDIIGIVDKSSKVVANYSYDAWGVPTITQDSTDCGIASINPYRYRGYYYDDEIGMYYLQSRYYNPIIGRFVNSDDVQFIVTCADSLRTNLYSYCRNMITNYDDQDGRDAVWVQASKSVVKMGHTGLVFKYGSKWYYWYWGIHPKAAIWGYLASLAWSLLRRRSLIGTIYRVASTTVLATCKLQVVSSKKTITQKEARDLANRLYDSSTKFDKSLYIKGNFDNAYYYFRALNITRNYNLLRRNCMQTTVDGLYAGRFSSSNFLNHIRLTVARAMIVPNFAYSYMDRFF